MPGRVGFKYSCQSSHLYIMPVKRGYKIDGRDQTSEEKQQVWQFFSYNFIYNLRAGELSGVEERNE